jgi:excisionase family DNA binding protein
VNAEPELPLVLSVEEAAAVLRISRGAAYEGVRCGEIPSVRIGRTIRVPRSRLLALIDGDNSELTPAEAPRAVCIPFAAARETA